MEKYTPQEDLPEDIRSLPREETVCRFCGISYLVHHEIKKLEDVLQQLELQLKRLPTLEAAIVSLEKEKQEQARKCHRVETELAAVQLSLESATTELMKSKLLCKGSDKEAASLKEKLEAQDKVLNKKFQGMQRCVVYLKAELKELVGVTRNWCSRVTVGRTIIVEKVRAVDRDKTAECENLHSQLWEAKKALTLQESQLSSAKEEWSLEMDRLIHSSQRECRELLTKLHTTERKLEAVTTRWENQRTEIDCAEGRRREVEAQLQELTASYQQMSAEKDRHMHCLQDKLVNTERKLASTERSLEVSRAEQQKIPLLKESLSIARKEVALLRVDRQNLAEGHEEDLKKIVQEKDDATKGLMQELCTRQQKERDEFEARYRELQHKSDSTIAQLKSTLSVTELENGREVQSLQDELSKEKAVLDRELTYHLNQVKDLELRVGAEQKAKENLVAELELRVGSELEAKEKSIAELQRVCSDLECKLLSAYHEVELLQATVKTQCEERELLLDKLVRNKL